MHLSFLASKFTALPIDGYVGLAVAIFIVYSGFNLVKDTINPLLGEAPDPELVKSIEEKVLSYENILGTHDLIVHNYGPGKCMASIHAEIPSDISVMKIHEIIDKAEREISSKLNIYLVIHMDPICIFTDEVKLAYDEINKIIKYINEHFAEQLTLLDVSKIFNFNYYYLSSYFSNHNKEGFNEFLNKIRIEKACDFLRTDIPISDISSMVGYSDHSYFCKVFKKFTGVTPSKFRKDSIKVVP